MKRLRLVSIVLGLVALVFLILLSWLNYFYLPKIAKAGVVRGLEDQTGLKVELSRLSFHPLKGVTLESLKLRDPKEEEILFQAHRVYVQNLWIPLILKREFIVSSVTFEKPSFSLIRLEDHGWNFQELWKERKQGSPDFPFISKISIVNGDLLFTDQTSLPPFSKHITNLNGKVFVRLPAHLIFKGGFGVRDSPVSVTFQGSRSLKKETWSLRGEAKDLSLSELTPYTKHDLSFLESAKGNLSFKANSERMGVVKLHDILFIGETKLLSKGIKGEARLRLTGDLSYQAGGEEGSDYHFKATFSEGVFQVPFLKQPFNETAGEFTLKRDDLLLENVRATVEKTPLSLQGRLFHFQEPELDLTLNSQTDIQTFLENLPQEKVLHPISLEGPIEITCQIKGKINAPSLSGSIKARDLLAKDIPFLGEIHHLHGSIVFTESSLETSALTGQYQDFPFELKGMLTDFQNPFLNVELRFAHSLQKLEEADFFQTIPQEIRPNFEGLGQWNLTVKGPFRQLSQENISGNCRLQNATLRTPILPSAVEKIDGELYFDAEEITGKGITGIYSEDSFLLDGSLQKGQNPKVQFSLITKTFQLSSNFTLHGKDLYPFVLNRRTPQSSLSVEGEILNYEKPTLRLSGHWKGPVEELAQLKLLGERSFLVEPLKGNLDTDFSLSGPKDQPDEMIVSGEFFSPLLSYKALRFKDVSSRYTYHLGTLTLSQFSSGLFGGHLFGDAVMRLSDEKQYKLDMELKAARLLQVIHSFVSTHKGVQGFLSGALRAEGDMLDARSLVGDGWVKVEEGNLFQLAILTKLTPVLRPFVGAIYPELDEMITFQEAYAHFDVRDKTIKTENLVLKGNRANLYGQGSIGFDRSLDFRIWVQFTDPDILERPTEISRLKNIFVNEMGMLSGEVRVTGTLKEPKYRYAPLPLDRVQRILQETGNFLFKRLFE